MVKEYEDFLDKMYELFPEVRKEYIDEVVKFGLIRLMSVMSDNLEYAIDYAFPKSSVFFSVKNDMGMTNRKRKLKELTEKRIQVQRENAIKREERKAEAMKEKLNNKKKKENG